MKTPILGGNNIISLVLCLFVKKTLIAPYKNDVP